MFFVLIIFQYQAASEAGSGNSTRYVLSAPDSTRFTSSFDLQGVVILSVCRSGPMGLEL